MEINKCRVCLVENNPQLLLLTAPLESANHETITYLECFEMCTRLDANEHYQLPQTLCFQCAAELRVAYDFIKKAIKSHEILLMKQEEIEIGTEELAATQYDFNKYRENQELAVARDVFIKLEENGVPAAVKQELINIDENGEPAPDQKFIKIDENGEPAAALEPNCVNSDADVIAVNKVKVMDALEV